MARHRDGLPDPGRVERLGLGALGALAFLPVPAVNATIIATVLSDAPEVLQGRAVSAATQLVTLFHPVGPALVGVLIEVLGTSTTVLWYGAAFLVLAVIATAARGLDG